MVEREGDWQQRFRESEDSNREKIYRMQKENSEINKNLRDRMQIEKESLSASFQSILTTKEESSRNESDEKVFILDNLLKSAR